MCAIIIASILFPGYLCRDGTGFTYYAALHKLDYPIGACLEPCKAWSRCMPMVSVSAVPMVSVSPVEMAPVYHVPVVSVSPVPMGLGLACTRGLGLACTRGLGLTCTHGLGLARVHGLGLTCAHGLCLSRATENIARDQVINNRKKPLTSTKGKRRCGSR